MQKQKHPNSAGFFSVFSPHPPFLNKETYEKVKAICNENEIDAEAFIFEVLRMALNHHKNEVEQIIKKVKR